MKNKIILLSFLVIAAFCSCNKDTFHNTADKVGISKVTHYVVLKLKGEGIVSVVAGGSFTDPGADATENGATAQYSTSGSVDVNTPGLYILTYSAVNKDGFSSSVSRTVVVIAGHENPGVDISGSYAYVGSSTYTSTVTKVAEGVYTTDNCWSGATVIPCIFVCLDGANITMPSQATAFGELSGTGTLDVTGHLIYVVSIPAQGINNSSRNWQKQ
ncbi:MAG TPA: immunoglobulin-like domain-containing protein [Puia sp.]|nr:immunoglobulin-like domain-containing protein [Puia sp.]